MERRTERMVASSKLNNVKNLGSTGIGTCPCCGELTMADDDTYTYFGTSQGVVYLHKSCMKAHNATEKCVGKSESKSRNYIMETTVSADDMETLAYLSTYHYFDHISSGVMVKVVSKKVINNSAMNKIYSGMVAYGDNRPITVKFDGGLIIKTRVSAVNDCIDLVNEMDKIYEGGNAWNKKLEKLLQIATIE